MPLLLAAMAMSSVVHADQLQDIKAKKTLVCGTFASVAPFGFVDPHTRQTVGFDVDVCKLIAKEMGVALVLRGLAVEARIPELNLGHVDILAANLAYTKTRAQQIDFSDPYNVLEEVIMVKKDSGITKLEELSGKNISVTKGATSEQGIRMRIPKAMPIGFQDASAAFLALEQGKVDGFGINNITASQFVRKSNELGKPVVVLGEPTLIEPICVGVKKGEPALLAEVNKILVKLEKSGELANNWDKWFGPKTAYDLKRTYTVMPLKDLKFDPLP